jgi:FkbM family methyltransferase
VFPSNPRGSSHLDDECRGYLRSGKKWIMRGTHVSWNGFAKPEFCMEDLFCNTDPAFTRLVTSTAALREPFVVIDVGVQGGAHQRWNALGDHLILHGFDALKEVIDNLTELHAGRTSHYFHNYAIGQADGQRTFYFNAANLTASSMFPQGETRYDRVLNEQPCTVTVRSLDNLFAGGMIPRTDFLKVDVEGFEQEVFYGAEKLLATGVLAIEAETNFGVSPSYRRSHFAAISGILVEYGFTVFDLGFGRIPRASFTRALRRRGVAADQYDLGRPAIFNMLFCRDALDERDSPQNYLKRPQPLSTDQIIKLMIIYELYGLNDIALDTAECFADMLGARFDVELAIRLLANPLCRGSSEIDIIKRSRSWRITAPLRSTKRFFTELRPRR